MDTEVTSCYGIAMGVQTVSLIIAAFVSGSLGIASLMRNSRSRLCVAFAALCGIFGAHDTLSVIESFNSVWQFSNPRLHSITVLLLAPVSLFFLEQIVPQYRSTLRKIIWGYLPTLFGIALYMGTHSYNRFSPWILVLSHLALVIPAGIWMFALELARKQTSLPRERLRLRYAFFGVFLTGVFFLTDILYFVGAAVPPIGNLARVLYLMFVFQTYIQKELITSAEVAAKIALFGSLALILSFIYFLLVSWVGDRVGLFFFNTFIASFVILVLFDPLRKLTARFTRSLFLRNSLKLEEEINSLSLELMGIVVEPIELSQRIATALKRSLGIDASALYLQDRDGLSYIKVGESNIKQFIPELSSSSPMVEYMSLRRGRPFVLETVESDRDSFYSGQAQRFCQSCIDTLRTLGADFVIPFLHESRLIGFLAATTDERILLSNEQLRLFLPLARQIALLLNNAQTFTYLRNRDKLAAVGELAAGLAHEIKNPLGAIKGAAQLLSEDVRHAASDAQDYLKIIVTEVNRLSGVLTEFLDYAKPRRNYPRTSCNPVWVVEHTAELFVRNSKTKIEIEAAPHAIRLEADPEILKQVLLNLFLNAVESIQDLPRDPEIVVRVKEIKPRRLFPFSDSLPLHKVWEGWDAERPVNQPAFIEIEIEDNGQGIQPEDRPRIFMPFFTTKAKGTGLGLAICQRLVEGLGGSISFKPAPIQGTVFSLHLPVKRDEAAAADAFVGPNQPLKTLESLI